MTHAHLSRCLLTLLGTTVLLAACSQPSTPGAPEPGTSTPATTPPAAPVASAPATPPPADDDPAVPPASCDATRAQWAIGQSLDEALLERARVDAGAGQVRSLKPDQVVTMEFNGERLNVDLDAAGNVTGVRCG